MHHELNDEIRYSIILPDTPMIIYLFLLFFLLLFPNDLEPMEVSLIIFFVAHALDCSWQIDNQSILCGNIVYHTVLHVHTFEIGSILSCASLHFSCDHLEIQYFVAYCNLWIHNVNFQLLTHFRVFLYFIPHI